MGESKEELKSLLRKVKEESEKAGLKLNTQKTKIMASSPITSWQIEGEKVKAVTEFIFLGSIITMALDCSHEIKRCWLLGSKAMTNLDSILKTRDITLLTKAHIIMYGCKSQTIKKTSEGQRNLVCCSPWGRKESDTTEQLN